jgi:DNA-binding transcriptional regulator YiaG
VEEWRDVPGFEGLYQASNTGKIRSYDRLVTEKGGKVRLHRGCTLYQGRAASGYPSVNLYVGGQRTTTTVHRLVMATFIGPCPDNHEVNHCDGNKCNNNLENLEYVTHSRNQQHSIRVLGNPAPPRRNQSGECSASAKLTERDVKEIRMLYQAGNITQERLGHLYHVSQSLVSGIVHNTHWRHVAYGAVHE